MAWHQRNRNQQSKAAEEWKKIMKAYRRSENIGEMKIAAKSSWQKHGAKNGISQPVGENNNGNGGIRNQAAAAAK
jgi:hypothetical protein